MARRLGLLVAVALSAWLAGRSLGQDRSGGGAAGSEVAASGSFTSDGLHIHYETMGKGKPIVLVHGWGVSAKRNWVDTGWVKALSPLRRVITIDCRGHGESDKPHEQARYGYAAMAGDIVRLLDHLGVERADYLGYSMGAFMGAHLLGHERGRFTAMVLAGIGDETDETKDATFIAQALRAKDRSRISSALGLGYRLFVEADPRNDLEALAVAALQMWPEGYPLELGGPDLAKVDIPVLIVNGSNDHYAESNKKLSDAIHGARAIEIRGADHLSLVDDSRFKDEVSRFLKRD
ncbi:MAG TPA: alpha/beta hydrolase [Planctomycetota bacterium]|nr:alpha/beta hydrolase [Planctomycetota bacterium]